MALVLHLKYAENLPGRAERLAKVSFRGVSHYTKVVDCNDDSVWFDETFQWPVARPIEKDEYIDIQLYSYNKYLSNRLVGLFRMILQQLVEVGSVKVSDSLLDTNNVVMKTTLTFELTYNAPDGSVGMWQRGGFEPIKSDELRGILTEEERNQLNIERRASNVSGRSRSTNGTIENEDDEKMSLHSSGGKSMASSRLSIASKTSGAKSPKTMKQITTVMKFMLAKQKATGMEVEDKEALIEDLDADESLDAKAAEVASMLSGAAHDKEESYDRDSDGSSILQQTGIKRKAKSQNVELLSLKAQDFQVCVTVIEARQLAGLNMDPVVCVQVGDQKKYTSVKESTNCPYYNEYFVFDFHMAPAMLFDKIITLTAMHSRNLLSSGKKIGVYKFDVGTVYSMPDHQFYHKWAMLMDPDDMSAGVKGYLKCDIAVIGKGDSVKVPPRTDKDDDDIEANLLLPDGVPADRQRANFMVKIYKAEGLPKMNTSVMASVKKALTGEGKDLVDPYVQVSFAGHKGRTSVKKGAYEPVWNEQLVFSEMFPPLCRRIKIQLRDSHKVNDDIIGTHYIDLAKIENEGEKGFVPTFGPSWVNLYGSTRDYSLLDEHTHLNDGLGEGVSYRGRVLVAIRTDILDSMDSGPANVDVEPTAPIPENVLGRYEEYFLFGCFLEASMIEKKIGDKPVHFEVSVGNAGNAMDGYNPPTRQVSSSSDESSEEEDADDNTAEEVQQEAPKWQSVTPPMKPTTKDKVYYHLPYYEEKPCIYLREMFEDHRRRMYNSNILEKIAEKLEDGIAEVNEMINQETPFPEKRLRGVFEELGASCSKFVSLVKGTGGGASAGKTKLDKERHKLLVRELDQMSTMSRTMKATTAKSNLKDRLRTAHQYLQKIRSLVQEPQHALPDVFIWLISGSKRIAYQRLPARDLIYSIVDEECGRDCGKVKTLLLKLPGKKASSQAGWSIQAKLQVYLWLGLSKHKKDFLQGLPHGYQESRALKLSSKPQCVPPSFILYTERQVFQLRAHMYQARSLIGSDASGLSDPFARVAFIDQSVCTQVIEETLSPTWDEMLIINEGTMYGLMQEIANTPPTIVVEIFDQDKVGKSEFIGRALCKPVVKLSTEKYNGPKFPPLLEWWDIFRGPDRAGELLAAFELLQFPFDEDELKLANRTPPYARKTIRLAPFGDMTGQDLPPLELPAETDRQDRGPIMPVPKGVRPVLSTHRIEILFWGVRDLKRVQLTSVDKPRIDVECAGHVLQSACILHCKKNPNFSVPVKYFDVELPENELYCPPITIRCVDCRNFGRYVLVGTHVINSIHKFMYIPTTKKAKLALRKLFPGKKPGATHVIQTGPMSEKMSDVAINMGENSCLIKKETQITIDHGVSQKELKTEENNRRRRRSTIDDEDPDEETMDWWSKYFVSMETLIMEPEDPSDQEHDAKRSENFGDPLDFDNQIATLTSNQKQGQKGHVTYGSVSNSDSKTQSPEDPDFNPKEAKKMEEEIRKMEKRNEKQKFKNTAKAIGLATKLSPKSQRKKDKLINSTAQLKTSVAGHINKAFTFMTGDADEMERRRIECITGLKIYPNELESQTEFNSFKDWLHTFELYRGKNMGNEVTDEGRIVGKFKGSLKIYKIPLPADIEDKTITGGDPQFGLFQGLPGNEPIKVLVRVYVVKGNDLHPADMNGKADPYLVIRLGNTTINDKDSYISKQLNPVFGKCFEIEATFPMESLLSVQVYDWDLVGMDDLIGETKVDLENRYYSRHRATCGVGKKFDTLGYNAWRDPMKPTQILSRLCKEGKVDGPHYQPGKVRVANRIFTAPIDELDDEDTQHKSMEEHLALAVLNHWEEIPKVGCKLVPEHIETRPLYNPEKPGIEQGKLEMWVDMFPMDMPAPPPAVDISPRKPKSYELRCIIWNTDDVVLEDDAFFTGEKMSDIYVKGWIKGQEDMQSTDIHYRSLTGEGNFNWRFIFPFDYLVAEEKIVISRKETLFSWDETETKIPARLNLQVWDADHFSADDFLGALTLDLNRFPRGAKSSKLCTLNMLKNDGSVPQMSLFKQKRVKGWWPFAVKNEQTDELELTGKVEAELHLYSAEEAEKHPAGQGRNEPDPLEKPNRPDSSFMWFLNPLKSLRYILWYNYKWMIIKVLVVILLAAILVLFFYSMPGYSAKKLMGV
ncbi:otoferlin-like isoform X2 [Mya arenaria]|uniref:otoferlin-like isoform X2 n=1 Tax=Mya arenaria TaxID=6604 RepID=UPI0022DEF2F7|nr:otoferlin-like isoform X2 [Mya arenaria]